MHILCLVLLLFCVFFLLDSRVAPLSLLGRESPCHACTYRHTAIFFPVQAALLSAQPCLQNPCFLVSRLLYRVCNLCSCLSGHLHLAYNKVWRREVGRELARPPLSHSKGCKASGTWNFSYICSSSVIVLLRNLFVARVCLFSALCTSYANQVAPTLLRPRSLVIFFSPYNEMFMVVVVQSTASAKQHYWSFKLWFLLDLLFQSTLPTSK